MSDSRTRLTALTRAVAVMAPLCLGVGVDRMSWGLSCSFGAYLTLAAFSSLREHPRGPVLVCGGAYLSLAAAAGAPAAGEPLALLVGATLLAGLQGVFETAGGPLKLVAAMAVLSFLLAGVNLAHGMPWWEYAAAFAVGTLWQAAVTGVTGGPPSGPAPRKALRPLVRPPRQGIPYAVLLSVIGAVGTATAWFIPSPHAVWLTTSALRVAKPEPKVFHARVRSRVVGTVGGGVIAAVLLTPALPVLLLAALAGAAIFAMQLLGAARYGWWTLCLTVVALLFGMEHGTGDWELAALRIGLTVCGAALTVLAYAAFERLVRTRSPAPDPAQRDRAH